MLPFLLVLPSIALALPAGERWLSTDFVAVGIAQDGSFGNEAADLGLYFDPDGEAGATPLGGDVLMQGRSFETWSLEADQGSWVQGAADLGSDLLLDWQPPVDDGTWTWIRGQGGDDAVLVDGLVALPWGRGQAFMVLDLVALDDLAEVWLSRSYDPDIDAPLTGTYATRNEVLDEAVVASGSVDGRAWALAALGGQGGIGDWIALPSQILDGTGSSQGDDQLGLAVSLGDLSAGDGARVVFVYGFGLDADAALALAGEGAALELDWDRLGEEAEDTGDGGTDSGVEDSGWDGREDWEEEIPPDEASDGGAEPGDGGGASPDEDAEEDDEETGGCACGGGSPVTLLGLLLPLLASARRRP